jgi:hypothetical protein
MVFPGRFYRILLPVRLAFVAIYFGDCACDGYHRRV